LRAAVLSGNDGITSTASLIIGVASAQAEHGHLVLTGLAGLGAGTMSMATGEYMSVSSRADTEKASLRSRHDSYLTDAPVEKLTFRPTRAH
jgi:VIT1/CCC1 family predicted Fe2+/Mn2+ transporter